MNKSRGVTTNDYLRMLGEVFSVLALVVKRGAPALLFLHEEDAKKLDAMVDVIGEAGFRILDEHQMVMGTKPIGSRSKSGQGGVVTLVVAGRELS